MSIIPTQLPSEQAGGKVTGRKAVQPLGVPAPTQTPSWGPPWNRVVPLGFAKSYRTASLRPGRHSWLTTGQRAGCCCFQHFSPLSGCLRVQVVEGLLCLEPWFREGVISEERSGVQPLEDWKELIPQTNAKNEPWNHGW